MVLNQNNKISHITPNQYVKGFVGSVLFNLRIGVRLSPEQISQLTADIVWFENQTVTLPDGSQQTVLAPRVYLMTQKEGALTADVINGLGVISAKNLLLDMANLKNTGTLAPKRVAQFKPNISTTKVALQATD